MQILRKHFLIFFSKNLKILIYSQFGDFDIKKIFPEAGHFILFLSFFIPKILGRNNTGRILAHLNLIKFHRG